MIELPIIVDLTVNRNEVVFDFDLENTNPEIEFTTENVINIDFPVYDGEYVVDASMDNAVVLETAGKLLAENVTVNKLKEQTVTAHNISVNQNRGSVTSTVTMSAGYSPEAFTVMKSYQLPTLGATEFTPATQPILAVRHGTYVTGDISIAAVPTYDGETVFTPTEQTQTVQISNKMSASNITINPIPSNYGRIEWNGSYLAVI